MRVREDEELADLTARAEKLGFEIFCDQTWGYVLRRIGRENTDLEDLREKLDGIEWGRGHATPAMPTRLGTASGNASAQWLTTSG
jgi:hypothetical protein